MEASHQGGFKDYLDGVISSSGGGEGCVWAWRVQKFAGWANGEGGVWLGGQACARDFTPVLCADRVKTSQNLMSLASGNLWTIKGSMVGRLINNDLSGPIHACIGGKGRPRRENGQHNFPNKF